MSKLERCGGLRELVAWEGDLLMGTKTSAIATLAERRTGMSNPQTKLDEVAALLNGRPRKTLGFMTPAETLAEVLDQAAPRSLTDRRPTASARQRSAPETINQSDP